MLWSILILTQPSRAVFLSQLLSILAPQLSTHPEIELMIRDFDTSMPLGENREAMRQSAAGQYFNFLDDDDLVAPNYISSIVPALTGVDQVSFNVRMFRNGKPMKTALHSLAHGGWREAANAYYRDISHATPMRKKLALSVPMSGGIGEDFRWANAMRGMVLTENHIEDALYLYLMRIPKNDQRDCSDPFRLNLLENISKQVS